MTAIATSAPLAFVDANEITQVHLSHSNNVSATVVMWTSGDSDGHLVQWGPSEQSLTFTAPATTSTYGIADMCDAPANTTESWWSPGFLHEGVWSAVVLWVVSREFALTRFSFQHASCHRARLLGTDDGVLPRWKSTDRHMVGCVCTCMRHGRAALRAVSIVGTVTGG